MDSNSQQHTDECITQIEYSDFKENAVIQGYNGMNPPTTLDNSVPANVYDIPLPPTTEHNTLVLNESIQNVQIDYPVTSQSIEVPQAVSIEQSDQADFTESMDSTVENVDYDAEAKVENVSCDAESNIIYENSAVTDETTEIIDQTETIIESTEDSKEKPLENKEVPTYMEVEESNSTPTTEAVIYENEANISPSIEQITHEHIEEGIKEESLLTNDVQVEAENAAVVSSDGHVQYTVLPPGENAVYQEDGTLVVEYPLHNEVQVNHEVEISQETIHEEVEISEVTLHEEVVLEESLPHDVEVSQEQELSETSLEIDETSSAIEITEVELKEEKPTPKPKGRKPATYIPLHIMGHDINKPVQEVPNGKPALKPRLGVKIPYRNLASQIVSTTELQQQIVERARQKQEAQTHVDVSNSFAKKLTHRLAQSLSGLGKSTLQKKENTESAPKTDPQKGNSFSSIVDIAALGSTEKNSDTTKSDGNISVDVDEDTSSKNDNVIEYIEQISEESVELSQSNSENSVLDDQASQLNTTESGSELSEILIISEPDKTGLKIESNSDLIAILEGDGDEGASIVSVAKTLEKEDSADTSSEMKDIEKAVSLREQKKVQTPQPAKEKKFFKSRDSRTAEAVKVKSESMKHKESNTSKETRNIPDSKVENPKNDTSKPHSSSRIDNPKGSSKTTVSDVRRTLQKDKERDKSKNEKKSLGIVEVEPQLKPAMVLKTYTRKRKSNDVPMPEPPKKLSVPEPIEPDEPDAKNDFTLPIPPNVYVTKSSRVIKRKVIWDPDEAMPSPRNQSKILSKIEASVKGKSEAMAKTVSKTPPKSTEKKSPTREKQTETPKNLKPAEKKITRASSDEKERTMKKPEKVELKTKSPIVVKSTTIIKAPTVTKGSPVQKSTGSPGTSNENNSTGKSPKQRYAKRLTEIDKLLMDEGAVNMLYDINNSDDQKRRGSARIAVTSTDKVQSQKELQSRTREIKNELTQGTAVEVPPPKNLRKKDAPPTPKKDKDSKEMVRKMSKDSSKSSNHSPPPSPAAFTLADASRIIRRHSSSSFSTDDDLVQESLDDEEHEKVKEKQPKKVTSQIPETSSSTVCEETTKAPEKTVKERVKKKIDESPDVPVRKKQKKEAVIIEDDEEPRKPVEITIKSEPGIVTGELKTDPTKSFTLIKMNKHYMINLTYSGGDNYLTVQLLKDLTITLKELGKNKNCNVVSLHSQGPSFCLGLDYKGLAESNEELRMKRASELSNCVRDFLKCLLYYPKVIVAGIKGDCVGFGVTMLPLFDMIIASDSASFCTPYGKLGCAPEGGFLLSVPFQSNHGLASELLFTTQRMNADDAYKRGLVTKLFWPEKFDTEFRALLLHISNLSKAGLVATKKQLRLQHCQNAEHALNINTKVLIHLWTSEECQKNFLNYNALTFDNDQ